MTQPFLETGQYVAISPGLDEQHPRGRQPGLLQRGCEQIGDRDDPKNLTFGSRGNPRGKTRRSGGVQGVVAAPRNLMQGTQRQTTARELPVDVPDAEGQCGTLAASVSFQTADRSPQRLQAGFFMGFSSHFTVWRPLSIRIS